MRKAINMILCYSVAMLLLLFGMNFDKAGEVFHTPNTYVSHQTSAVLTKEAAILEVEGEATKIIGTRSESPLQQIFKQTNQNKKDIKAFLQVFKVDSLEKYHSNLFMVTNVTKAPALHHRVAVLGYIHDLDGKKRVL